MSLTKQSVNTRKLIVLALFTALAFTATAVFRIPVVMWLKFDPKDCLLTIAGMLYGPAAATLVTVAVALLELFTVSDTGIYGFLMNVLASLLFVLPPSLFYRFRRKLSTAILGLAVGALLATGGMLLWNWLIVPLYTPAISRAEVVPMLWTVFLPFNLFKTALNAVLTMLLYKGVVTALRAAHLIPKPDASAPQTLRRSIPLVCLFLLATLILVLLAWQGLL